MIWKSFGGGSSGGFRLLRTAGESGYSGWTHRLRVFMDQAGLRPIQAHLSGRDGIKCFSLFVIWAGLGLIGGESKLSAARLCPSLLILRDPLILLPWSWTPILIEQIKLAWLFFYFILFSVKCLKALEENNWGHPFLFSKKMANAWASFIIHGLMAPLTCHMWPIRHAWQFYG